MLVQECQTPYHHQSQFSWLADETKCLHGENVKNVVTWSSIRIPSNCMLLTSYCLTKDIYISSCQRDIRRIQDPELILSDIIFSICLINLVMMTARGGGKFNNN